MQHKKTHCQAHTLALHDKDGLVLSHHQSLHTAERAIEALESQKEDLKRSLRQVCYAIHIHEHKNKKHSRTFTHAHTKHK